MAPSTHLQYIIFHVESLSKNFQTCCKLVVIRTTPLWSIRQILYLCIHNKFIIYQDLPLRNSASFQKTFTFKWDFLEFIYNKYLQFAITRKKTINEWNKLFCFLSICINSFLYMRGFYYFVKNNLYFQQFFTLICIWIFKYYV